MCTEWAESNVTTDQLQNGFKSKFFVCKDNDLWVVVNFMEMTSI